MQTFVVRYLVSMPLLCLAFALAGCDRSQTPDSPARSYQVRGIVRGFAPDRSTVSIEHENIPGYMPSMTMPFSVKDQKDVAGLKIGDGISFRMTVTDKDLFLDQVGKIPVSDVQVAEPTATAKASSTASARLREGDVVPSFTLTNQSGAPVTFDTFRGGPFVLTFIFTRCPIPSFCPRMAKHFGELQRAIKSGSGTLAETKLLSITIDPQNDTPAVLKEYAKAEGADPQTWHFATAEPAEISKLTTQFAVQVTPEAGTISHGLATVLIGRDGTIVKLWRGNGWTPEEVIAAITREH